MAPSAVQTLAWWTRSVLLFERCRARYGKRFTLRLLQSPRSSTYAPAVGA
jgi:hypothetical protein